VQGTHVAPVCLGRSEVVRQIVDAIESGRHASVSGHEGVGVTTILSEVTAELMRNGEQPILIRSGPLPRPYSALDPVTGAVPPAGRFEALASQVRQRIGPHNAAPILIVDDAHWVDNESADVVYQLAAAGAVRLVVAARTEAALPAALARLTASPNTRHVDVTVLGADSIDRLVAGLLPGHIERRTLRTLARTSGGNPSHLQALVQGSLAAGTLSLLRDTWRLTGPLHCTNVVAVGVVQSMHPQNAEQRDILDTLALVGELESDAARRMFAADDLEALERAGCITGGSESSGNVRLTSPLAAVVLSARLGPFARERMYRQLAEQCSDEQRATSLDVVLWHIRGGVAIDPKRLLAAAHQAVAQSNLIMAAELASAAYAASESIGAAVFAIRYLLHAGHDATAFALAEAAYAKATDSFDRAVLLYTLGEEAWWMGESSDAAVERLAASAAAPLDLGEWSDLLEAQRTIRALLDGRLADGAACVALAEHPIRAIRLVAGTAASQLDALRGDPERGLAVASAFFHEASQPDIDEHSAIVSNPGFHMLGVFLSMAHGGQLQDVCTLSEHVLEEVGEGAGLRARAVLANMLGYFRLQAGAPSAAEPWFAEAEALWSDCGMSGIATWASAGRTLALAAKGDVEGAREALTRTLQSDRRGFGLMEPFVALARTWVAVLDDDLPAADLAAFDAVERSRTTGAIVHEGTVVHDLARLGLRDATAAALTGAQSPCTAITRAQFGFAEAWLADNPEQLETVGGQWAELGAQLFAAEAYTRAGDLFRQQKDTVGAARVDGLAAKLLRICDPARTPALASSRRSVGPLTPRLVEVAQLASQGLRNSDIAERLVISQRSVESHLRRIYLRLGVASRTELAGQMELLLAAP
jgi:DNA-binding CsgD family transcriptional regulator